MRETDVPSPIITLLTDFGLTDGYAAGMKGVILGICPDARIVDISHLAPARDIRAGAFLLESVHRDFPPGTIHVAVVDPGVGTKRLPIAVRTPDYIFIGPDNGIFSQVLQRESEYECRIIENPLFCRPEVSRTFHGRDIFAPAAAHLAAGASFEHLGPECLPTPAGWGPAIEVEGGLLGEVVYIDHFGNAITNLSQAAIASLGPPDQLTVRICGKSLRPISRTYGEKEPGALMALIGSGGYLEIAVNGGSAAELLGIAQGEAAQALRTDSSDS